MAYSVITSRLDLVHILAFQTLKFCMVVDIPDAVKYTNFGDHRLRGLWVAGGQISPSPIDFHCRPYNTLALPCERVILCLAVLVELRLV